MAPGFSGGCSDCTERASDAQDCVDTAVCRWLTMSSERNEVVPCTECERLHA